MGTNAVEQGPGRSLDAPTLDNNTNRVSRAPTKYELREVARKHTRRARLQKCGHCRVAPMVWLVRQSGGRVTYAGLVTCGSAWCCPVCSAKITAGRRDQLLAGLENWYGSGGKVAFLTLTMPHNYGDDLRRSVSTVRGAFRRVLQGRGYVAACAGYGIAGFVAAVEVTHGTNGWHPHMHALFFLEHPLTDSEFRDLQAWLFGRWANGVRRGGYRAPDVRNCPLERVAGPEIGRYISKFGAASEVTQWNRKRGRQGSRTPFQILADLRCRADAADVRLWREYEGAMFGVRQLTWSKGLRNLLQVHAVPTDAALCEEEPSPSIAIIGPELWDAIAEDVQVKLGLLAAAEGGYEAARAFLMCRLAKKSVWLAQQFQDAGAVPTSAISPVTRRPAT